MHPAVEQLMNVLLCSHEIAVCVLWIYSCVIHPHSVMSLVIFMYISIYTSPSHYLFTTMDLLHDPCIYIFYLCCHLTCNLHLNVSCPQLNKSITFHYYQSNHWLWCQWLGKIFEVKWPCIIICWTKVCCGRNKLPIGAHRSGDVLTLF